MKINRKGNIAITLIMVLFITMVGLTLLSFSISHTRIVRARSYKLKVTGDMYQDFIYYLHYFREKIFSQNMQGIGDPLVGYFNNVNFETKTINDHRIEPSFKAIEIPLPEDQPTAYKKTKVTVFFSVTCPGTAYRLDSEVDIMMFSGNVPLSFIPLSIRDSFPVTEMMNRNNIKIPGNRAYNLENETISSLTSEYLLNTLKISGAGPVWKQIRERVGLPILDTPIPDGIYIIRDNIEPVIRSIFIQGDLERLEFGCDKGMQYICFRKEDHLFLMKYKQETGVTTIWDNSIPTPTIFNENIIVNGNIRGIRQIENSAAAFLMNTRIALHVTGTVVFQSSLDHETDQFKIKETDFSNLTVTCSQDRVFDKGAPPEITIEGNGDITLSTTLITDGKIINKSKNVNVRGGFHALNIENQGDSITIEHKDASKNAERFFCVNDFTLIKRFIIQYIEEVPYD